MMRQLFTTPKLLALDCCSGPRAPVSFALAWMGWQVQAYDLEMDPAFDLAGSTALHEDLWARRSQFLIRLWTVPCSTMSRVREIARPRGPPPLRSAEHPEGLPSLAPRDRLRVDRDTALARNAAMWAEDSALAGDTATILEHPRSSYLWELAEVRALERHAHSGSWFRVDYDACCYSGARCKKQTLGATFPQAALLSAKCSHLHDRDEWSSRRQGERWATTAEKEVYRSPCFCHSCVANHMGSAEIPAQDCSAQAGQTGVHG